MKRLFYLLSLLFTLLLVPHTEVSAHDVGRDAAVCCDGRSTGHHERRDGLYEVKATENSHEAVIDNSVYSFRVAGSRPARVMPSLLSGGHQGTARMPRHYVPLPAYGLSLRVRETLPIRSCASVRYHVFALRHILC